MPHRTGNALGRLSRRRLLQAAGAVGAGSVVGVGLSGAQAGGDLLWERTLHDSDSGALQGPTVVDGTAFVSGGDGQLWALSSADGTEQWTFESGNDRTGGPVVADGTVYFGTTTDDRVDALHAVGVDSGRERWQRRWSGTRLTYPSFFQGTVYATTRRVEQTGSDTAVRNGVSAFDATDGREQWRTELPSIGDSLTVVDGAVYAARSVFRDGQVYALDAGTGAERWSVALAGGGGARPLTNAGDTLFVGSVSQSNSTSVLQALGQADGAERWRFETGGGLSVPTVAADTVYASAVTDAGATLFALDAATGQVQWRVSRAGQEVSSPTIADDVVFFGTDDGIYAVDAADGTEQWATDRSGGQLLVVGGVLFASTFDDLYAFDAGVAGSSDGSRVQQGTLGHHDGLRGGSVTVTSRQENGITVTTEETDGRKQTTVSVAEATSGDPVEIPLDLRISDSTTVDELTVAPAVDGGFELTITSDDQPLETTPDVPMLAPDQQLGFYSIDSTLSEADIAEVRFRYTVDPTAAAAEIDAEEVTLYRLEDEQWVAYPTELAEKEATLQFETTVPGFSEWTAGAKRPDISITDTEASVSTVKTGEAFDIDVTLRNPAEASDVYVTELLFEGEVVERRQPRVPAETAIVLTFTRNVAQAGEYTVRVNDVDVGVVTVEDTGDSDSESDDNDLAQLVQQDLPSSLPPLSWVLGGAGGLGVLGGGYLLGRNNGKENDDD